MQHRAALLCFAFLAVTCGPAARQQPGDDDSNPGDAGGGGGGGGGGGDGGTCVPQGSNISGSDGSGCGTVNVPLSMPLALPDTNTGYARCTTDAQCTSTTAPTCVMTADTTDGPGVCELANIDTLDFIGFCPNETLDDPSKLVSVCATLEHTWVGDLEIDLVSPDGKIAALHQFIGLENGGIMLGHPNYCDSDQSPVPGSGYTYCWTNSATVPLVTADHSTCGSACESWNGNTTWCPSGGMNDGLGNPPFKVVPAGNYKPDQPFASLQGAQLNGTWSLRITDLWALDNGYLFNWSIQFDPSLLPSCGGPIIQ